MDVTPATTLTHATNRSSTRTRAIFLAVSASGAVARTTCSCAFIGAPVGRRRDVALRGGHGGPPHPFEELACAAVDGRLRSAVANARVHELQAACVRAQLDGGAHEDHGVGE